MNRKIISLDFAIKTILKAADKKVVEGLLTAIMKYVKQDNQHIEIVDYLDKELIKDNDILKTSIADLLVKDENNNYYVFEIERTDDKSIFHKALSTTSKIIHNCVLRDTGTKRDYLSIKKVFHLTLAFFDIGNDATVVHGNTSFTNLTKNKPFEFHINNQEGKLISATDVFPEYLTLCVNNFNDKVKSDIDEWLYAFKHEEIKEEFNAPGIKEAAKKLDYLKMTPKQKTDHDKYCKDITDRHNQFETAMDKGIAKGIAKGRAEGETGAKKSMIINMLNENIDKFVIAKCANVDISIVEKISSELS